MEEEEDPKNMATKFYTELFTSDPESGREFIRGRFPPIKEEASQGLEAGHTMAETWKALKGMSSLKAPGSDDYQSIFFKRTWETTGLAVYDFAQRVLRGEDIPMEATEALLVLIPKEEKSVCIRCFRPISLCSICVMLMTKMIVNQLKIVQSDIVAQTKHPSYMEDKA